MVAVVDVTDGVVEVAVDEDCVRLLEDVVMEVCELPVLLVEEPVAEKLLAVEVPVHVAHFSVDVTDVDSLLDGVLDAPVLKLVEVAGGLGVRHLPFLQPMRVGVEAVAVAFL